MRKSWRVSLAMLALTCAMATASWADAVKQDWFGTWSMNHDGHVGTLTITDIKADCASTVWCDMAINYVDSEGKTIHGTINRIDDHLQHMQFTLAFPGNNQRFDAYIFSWDKTKLAGLTYWGGRKFGFYAVKQ